MTEDVPTCDGCGHNAPRRRGVYYSTGASLVLAGRYGRVCFVRSVIALREANLVPMNADGSPVRYGRR